VSRTPSHALIFLLPSLLHDLANAAGFLLRRPLLRQARGWQPRALAYACSFLVMGFVAAASSYRPEWLAITANHAVARTGFLLWSLGTAFAAWTVWVLRPAFSLVPQARVLVTAGPFRVARHPIYTSYILEYAGFWLMHDTWAVAGVLALWMTLTCMRARAEETVLMESFPEYASYRQCVPAFGVAMPRWIGFRPARALAAESSAANARSRKAG
jgi:protein-S-isoprenylcysteine O-methyltransferase Ste14